jgi:Fe-S-cluster-containing dehydrogenase component
MVIDQSKCVGCDLCLRACAAVNDTPPDIAWSRVERLGPGADGEPMFRPSPCMHCQDAPCAEICPVGATYVRADGIVMMDYDRCIGCRYCQLACPYGARSFNWDAFTGENPAVPAHGHPEVPRRPRGVVEKCSFCYQRIDRGLATGLMPGVDPAATPACVVACTYGARIFGDLNDPDSPVSVALRGRADAYRLREELGTEPRVYYLPVEASA